MRNTGPTFRRGLRLACAATVLLAFGARAAPTLAPSSVVVDWHEGPSDRGGWDYAAIDANDGKLLVGRMTGVQAFALDTLAPSMLSAGRHVHAVLPLPGHRILFTNGDDGTIRIADAATGRMVGAVSAGPHPDGALFDPAAQAALVMDGDRGTIARVDTGAAAPRLLGTIAVGGKLEAAALVGADLLFVNVEDRNEVAVVSLRGQGQVRQRIALAGCDAPSGLAFDPSTGSIVSACANGVAKVLDKTGEIRATLPIGVHPDAAIADPAHHRVLIPSGGDGTLAEISLDGTPRVTRVWATRPGARTGAYDPRTGRVYLPYGAVTRDAQNKAHLVPGSFGVLVLDVR